MELYLRAFRDVRVVRPLMLFDAIAVVEPHNYGPVFFIQAYDSSLPWRHVEVRNGCAIRNLLQPNAGTKPLPI